jgi:hypothetical protein
MSVVAVALATESTGVADAVGGSEAGPAEPPGDAGDAVAAGVRGGDGVDVPGRMSSAAGVAVALAAAVAVGAAPSVADGLVVDAPAGLVAVALAQAAGVTVPETVGVTVAAVS